MFGPSSSAKIPTFLILGGDARAVAGSVLSGLPSGQVIEISHPAMREPPWPALDDSTQNPFGVINRFLGNRSIDWRL